MKEYKVRIEETNARTIVMRVEDDKSEEDINEIVEALCDEGVINLDYEDFAERNIEIQGAASELDKKLFEQFEKIKTIPTVLEAKKEVYMWLNIYKNIARNGTIYEKLLQVHKQYIDVGGKYDMSYFENTLNDYVFNGYCGY